MFYFQKHIYKTGYVLLCAAFFVVFFSHSSYADRRSITTLSDIVVAPRPSGTLSSGSVGIQRSTFNSISSALTGSGQPLFSGNIIQGLDNLDAFQNVAPGLANSLRQDLITAIEEAPGAFGASNFLRPRLNEFERVVAQRCPSGRPEQCILAQNQLSVGGDLDLLNSDNFNKRLGQALERNAERKAEEISSRNDPVKYPDGEDVIGSEDLTCKWHEEIFKAANGKKYDPSGVSLGGVDFNILSAIVTVGFDGGDFTASEDEKEIERQIGNFVEHLVNEEVDSSSTPLDVAKAAGYSEGDYEQGLVPEATNYREYFNPNTRNWVPKSGEFNPLQNNCTPTSSEETISRSCSGANRSLGRDCG